MRSARFLTFLPSRFLLLVLLQSSWTHLGLEPALPLRQDVKRPTPLCDALVGREDLGSKRVESVCVSLEFLSLLFRLTEMRLVDVSSEVGEGGPWARWVERVVLLAA